MDLEEYSLLLLCIALCLMIPLTAGWMNVTEQYLETPQGLALVVLICCQWALLIIAWIAFLGLISSEEE